VSFLQERDECSKEIARMRLEEKYEVEMSQLAKDSQAVPSFTWEHWHISYRSCYGTFLT
jgi:hypothetical protein